MSPKNPLPSDCIPLSSAYILNDLTPVYPRTGEAFTPFHSVFSPNGERIDLYDNGNGTYDFIYSDNLGREAREYNIPDANIARFTLERTIELFQP